MYKSVVLFFGTIFLLFFAVLFSALAQTSTPNANTSSLNKPVDVKYNTDGAQADVEDFGNFSPVESLGELAQRVITFAMAILGGVALLGIIAGGVMVMGGAFSETTKERGKELLLYSIIGVSVAILSVVIVTLAQTFFYSIGS